MLVLSTENWEYWVLLLAGVLGAQGSNSGVLVFKHWVLWLKSACQIGLKFPLGDLQWVH